MEPAPLLALSLTQPYATLMWGDDKGNETRDWSTPYRGDVAICSSSTFPRKYKELSWTQPFRSTLQRNGATFMPGGPVGLPFGKVLCVVELYDVIRTKDFLATWPQAWSGSTPPPRPFEVAFGDYTEGKRGKGRFALLTRNLRRLPEPVPVWHLEKGIPTPGGALSLFKMAPPCEAAVRAQLAAAGGSR